MDRRTLYRFETDDSPMNLRQELGRSNGEWCSVEITIHAGEFTPVTIPDAIPMVAFVWTVLRRDRDEMGRVVLTPIIRGLAGTTGQALTDAGDQAMTALRNGTLGHLINLDSGSAIHG